MPGDSQPVVARFTKGSYIILEGKPSADRFYIIKEGKVQVIRETDAVISESNMAGPGEMLGVISAMASRNYFESAVALTDVTLLAVERSLITRSTSIAVNIITQFSQRLRKLNETLSRGETNSAAMNNPSYFLQLGDYYAKAGKGNQALYSYELYVAACPDAGNIENVKKKIVKVKARGAVARPVYSPDTMIQKYPKNCLLFAEGESGHNLYIIQEGSVKITKIADDQEVVLAVLNKGDIFGEMAMLEDKPRAATAEIYENSILLSINRSNFSNLINEQPDMVIRLTTLMAERIRLLYRQFANTLIDNPLGRMYGALLIQLEKNRVDLNSTMSYQCNFGFKELAGMAGIPEEKSVEYYGKLSAAKRISLKNDKVFVLNVASIYKEADYYLRARKKSGAKDKN